MVLPDAKDMADRRHQMALCAHNYVEEIEKATRDRPPRFNSDEDWEVLFAPDEKEFSFAKAKCSISEAEPITFAEARNPPTFHWLFAAYAAPGIALALGIAACIYGLLRAIGGSLAALQLRVPADIHSLVA